MAKCIVYACGDDNDTAMSRTASSNVSALQQTYRVYFLLLIEAMISISRNRINRTRFIRDSIIAYNTSERDRVSRELVILYSHQLCLPWL